MPVVIVETPMACMKGESIVPGLCLAINIFSQSSITSGSSLG